MIYYNNRMEKNLLNLKLMNNVCESKQSADCDEYLLNPENNRLTIYPIKDKEIWQAYMDQLGSFWTAEEIDFHNDASDFMKLNECSKSTVNVGAHMRCALKPKSSTINPKSSTLNPRPLTLNFDPKP